MTKKLVTRTIDIQGWSLDSVIAHIDQLGLTTSEVDIELRTEYDYNSEYKVPVATYQELETDEEYTKRFDEERAFKVSAVEREKQEYLRLKKKYG